MDDPALQDDEIAMCSSYFRLAKFFSGSDVRNKWRRHVNTAHQSVVETLAGEWRETASGGKHA
jgi:hypothetical protein